MIKSKYFVYTTGLITAMLNTGCNNEGGSKLSSNGLEHAATSTGNYIIDPDKLEIRYPESKQVNVSDSYFGTEVKDPYRWLEADSTNQTEVDAWVKSQSQLAEHYLAGIPFRDKIYTRLEELWNYEKYSAPFKKHGKFYFYKNNGLQNHSVLYQQDKLDSEPRVFIDPNTLSEDGSVSLQGIYFSNSGKYFAYGTSGSGSDWTEIRVKDLATGKDLNDKVEWLRYSGVAWWKDGFFYSRYEATGDADKYTAKNEFHQVYYHKIGSPQTADELVYMDKSNPQRNFSAQTTRDERFLFLYASETTHGNALYFRRLQQPNTYLEPLITTFDHEFWVIDNTGDRILVLTNYKAARRRLVEIDINKPQEVNWKTIIPESENVLEGATVVGGRIVAEYLQHACSRILFFEMSGKAIGELQLPDELEVGQGVPVTISGVSGEKEDMTGFFTVSSFAIPTTICRIDMKTLQANVWKKPAIKFNVGDYKTDQVTFQSKDGTTVRMFLTYKVGLERKGDAPTLMYGYGGFNIPLTPGFSLTRIPFLEKGGIYAVVNLRGGGEYGEAWYKAGTKLQKQNVFDDFIAAGEYLIAQGYTSKERLAIEGGSNGGLLVGACMTQRPDLFRVAIPAVGVLDMLRYHKFTIGRAWANDYGTSEESAEMFQYLLKYSPVHNARTQKYPATMVMTADHDDRVVPAHSFKFAAALQANQDGNAPVLLRVDTKAGHGSGKSTKKVIQENADKIAFILFNMGFKDF